MDSGIIYEKDGLIERSEGAFLPKGAEILGGWAVVYRKDRSHPTKAEVTFSEYDNSKIRKNGPTDQYGKPTKANTWDEKPAVMIHKVAMVTALRNAFPNELGGLYEADELREPKDVTPQETQEEVRARKMAQIEQMKQEQQSNKPAEKINAEDAPLYTGPVDGETGEILDNEEEPF